MGCKMYLLLICLHLLVFYASGQTTTTGTTQSVTPCPRTCGESLGAQCDCYTDGWIDCLQRDLSSIPQQLPTCARNLVLKRNNISRIGILDFQGLGYLNLLDINFNQITELEPGVFSYLTRLNMLNLEYNQISQIHECAFQGLSSLLTLHLNDNKILNLPSRAFSGLPSLHTLHLENNRISRIDGNAFKGLSLLSTLRLSDNRILNLSGRAFGGLRSLNILHLEKNRISEIDANAFEGLSSVLLVQLGSNNIQNIPETTFDGLTSLQSLDLFNNSMTKIHRRWFQDKVNFSTVLVAQNNWNCTCMLKQDYTFIISNFSQVVHCPGFPLASTIFNQMCISCSHPANLAGQILGDIPIANFNDCPSSDASTSSMSTVSETSTSTPFVEQTPPEMAEEVHASYCQMKIEQIIRSGTTVGMETMTDTTQTSVIFPSESNNGSLVGATFVGTERTAVSENSTNRQAIQQNALPTWAIILIAVTSTCIVAAGITAAVLFHNQGDKMISHVEPSQDETEMVANNFSNKSYDVAVNQI